MVNITGSYSGGLRCVATHGPSGAELITDAPVDNHGQGRAFSPTDLLATSLGVCMVTVMGIWAERHAFDMAGTTFSVQKDMSTSAPRRVSQLTVEIHVPGESTPEQRERLEAVAKSCPVHQSLHPDVVCEITFRWG